MATRRRKRGRQSKGKLALLWLPIALLIGMLVWLFLDEGKRLLTSRTTPAKRVTTAPSKEPPARSTERILDPERKKLEEILESR